MALVLSTPMRFCGLWPCPPFICSGITRVQVSAVCRALVCTAPQHKACHAPQDATCGTAMIAWRNSRRPLTSCCVSKARSARRCTAPPCRARLRAPRAPGRCARACAVYSPTIVVGALAHPSDTASPNRLLGWQQPGHRWWRRRVQPRLEERGQVLAADGVGDGDEVGGVGVGVAIARGIAAQNAEEGLVAHAQAQRLQGHGAPNVDALWKQVVTRRQGWSRGARRLLEPAGVR